MNYYLVHYESTPRNAISLLSKSLHGCQSWNSVYEYNFKRLLTAHNDAFSSLFVSHGAATSDAVNRNFIFLYITICVRKSSNSQNRSFQSRSSKPISCFSTEETNTTRMWANAQPDGRPASIGGALCSTPQTLANAHY